MRKYFQCDACESSEGPDQPAHLEDPEAGSAAAKPCLLKSNTRDFSCGGFHARTKRLCACVLTEVKDELPIRAGAVDEAIAGLSA